MRFLQNERNSAYFQESMNVFLTACHTLFTQVFCMVTQINPLSYLSSVRDVCSVDCVIMHFHVYAAVGLLSHWRLAVFSAEEASSQGNGLAANCLREMTTLLQQKGCQVTK